MKRTPFTNYHEQAGAKMASFAGYQMPIEYTSVIEEHLTVRNKLGVFDVSHMGEIWVKGPRALDFIQKVCSNDASVLVDGKIQYACFPNGNGGIVDDLLVYKWNDQKYLLVVNASNIEKDWNWLLANNDMEVELENASDQIAQIAVQGPKTIEALQTLTNINLAEIPYYTFKHGQFAGVEDVIISATGYTGAGGFEIYMYNADAPKIWAAVMASGKDLGIQAIGLAARDTLRLEMGFALYGNDIDDSTSPIEAGLSWITKFNSNKNFIDKNTLADQKKNGVSRKLVGFEMIERGIPRHDYELADVNGTIIGKVTSGTQSPCLNKGIGMGYIKTEFSKIGTEIYVIVRNRKLKAIVSKTPFVEASV